MRKDKCIRRRKFQNPVVKVIATIAKLNLDLVKGYNFGRRKKLSKYIVKSQKDMKEEKSF